MKSTSPEDAAALFDLAPLPEAAPPAEGAMDAAQAEEAALAAELAATMASGGFATDAPDSRTDLRVKVSWPARMRLPDGRVIDLKVRDVSERGVGLMSDEHIPASTLVGFEVDVPPLDEDGATTPVLGTIKTTYTVVLGTEFLCGGIWQARPAGLELVDRWISRSAR